MKTSPVVQGLTAKLATCLFLFPALVSAEPAWDALSEKTELQVRSAEGAFIHNAAPTDVVLSLTNRNGRGLSGVARLVVPGSWRVEEGSNAPFDLKPNGGAADLTFRLRLSENVVPDIGNVPLLLRLFCGEDGIVTKRLTLQAQKVQEWLVLGPLDADFSGNVFTTRPETAFEESEVVARSNDRELRWMRVRAAGEIDLVKLLGPVPANASCQAVLCSYVSYCGSHDRKYKERFTLHVRSPNRAGAEINKTEVLNPKPAEKDGTGDGLAGGLQPGVKAGARGEVGVMLNEGWNFVAIRSYKGELDEKWTVKIDFKTSHEKHQQQLWYRYKTEERKDY